MSVCHSCRWYSLVHPVRCCFYRLSTPRILLASWMSRGNTVTRLAWMAHRLASENSMTRNASAAWEGRGGGGKKQVKLDQRNETPCFWWTIFNKKRNLGQFSTVNCDDKITAWYLSQGLETKSRVNTGLTFISWKQTRHQMLLCVF